MQMVTSGACMHLSDTHTHRHKQAVNTHTACTRVTVGDVWVASHPNPAGNYSWSQDAMSALLSLLTPTALTDDVMIYCIYTNARWHIKPGDYGNKRRFLTMLYARGGSREWDVIHLDSDASGRLKGAVTVGAQNKYQSVWLATKHYQWKHSYLTDMCVCVCVTQHATHQMTELWGVWM